ncbi:MAG: hypothetical protein AAFV30_12070 [Pseudomonadota bacterium]
MRVDVVFCAIGQKVRQIEDIACCKVRDRVDALVRTAADNVVVEKDERVVAGPARQRVSALVRAERVVAVAAFEGVDAA